MLDGVCGVNIRWLGVADVVAGVVASTIIEDWDDWSVVVEEEEEDEEPDVVDDVDDDNEEEEDRLGD